MSYRAGAALQAAIWERLTGDAALAALVGGAIHDAPPEGPLAGTHVLLGPEEVRPAGDGTGGGAEHRLVVSVITDAAGFRAAKAAAGAVSGALDGAAMALAEGRLVSMQFLRAVARRDDRAARRRIDLTFRARVET